VPSATENVQKKSLKVVQNSQIMWNEVSYLRFVNYVEGAIMVKVISYILLIYLI